MNSDGAQLEVGALSETGYVRDENQDRMSGSQVPLGSLYIVADGMGGHKGGALAAETAVQELQRHISQAPPNEPLDLVIEMAFKKANETVYKKAHSGDPATEGMGTTAVLMLVAGRVAKLAHVGDSRAYLYRNSSLTPLTRDHTIVQKMVEAGMLKPEEAADHPDASVLERAIGSTPTIEVDIRNHQLNEGDAILLCSDGLSGYVSDAEIETVLRSEGTVQEITEDLVKSALEKGGKDNVTVQLIKYGRRKEAQAVGQNQPVKPMPKPALSAQTYPAQHRRARWPTPAAFIITGLVVASFLVAYYLTTLKTAELDATREITSKLQTELETNSAALENATKRVEELKGQLAAAGQNAKASVAGLQKDLQDARSAREKAAKQVAELAEQLAAERQSAKATTAKLRKELQEANTAKENALTEAKGLRQKLDSKENELQQAKKQLESLTKANRASPAQQEATPTTAPGGTAPTTNGREAAPAK